MSTTVFQEFLVKLGFSVDKTQLAALNAGVAEAGAAAARLDKEAIAASSSISTRLAPALNALLNPLTAVAAAAALAYHEMVHFVESSAEGFDDVAKLSNRVNATAESILKLGYIAQVSGSSVEAARMSLDGLNKAAGEAALGVGRSKKIFKEIGVSVKDTNGHLKDTGDLIFEIGDKIKGMERGKQLAVLEKLRIDPTLIESLTTNVSGLGAEFDKLYKDAGIDATKAAESSQEFIDTMDKLKFVLKTIKDAVAVSFFDEFREGFDTFRQILLSNLPTIIATIKPIISNMVKIGEIFLKVGVVAGIAASNIIKFISKVNDATGGWALKIAAILYAWKKLNLAFLLSPIGIIIELATAFALLYDDYKTWERGGKSFIDWGSNSGKVIKIVTELLAGLATAFYAARTAVKLFTLAMNLNPAIAAITLLTADITLLISKLKEVKSLFSDINQTAANSDARSDAMKKHAGLIMSLPGLGLASRFIPPNTPLLGSLSGGAGTTNNKNITLNHKTDIHVNGTSNPYETATAVKNQQRAVTGDQVRYMQGAVR